jgi:branched-chain amino acid transport system ATP-binding protein
MVARSEAAVRARVDELVEQLGLGAFADKFVHELSTGTRRIVDLACVLAHEPRVILLDEPSSGIAQREAEALGPLLREVRDALGASLLVIEHDLTLLRTVSDRLIALDLGRVVAVGDPTTVLEHPDVVRSYLGT